MMSRNRVVAVRRVFELYVLLFLGLFLVWPDTPFLASQEKATEARLTDVQDVDTLRAVFNRDAGYVRLISILSPT